MKVHEIMTAHVKSVTPETMLVEAAGLMRELDVGALPVCDGGDLVGIVTDRDIIIRAIADGADPTALRVSNVMSGGVVAVNVDDDVEHAVRIMEQKQIRRIPVLDSATRLVGVVSLGDVATSSNPAFGGLALRDVSAPNRPSARRRRLEQQSEPAGAPYVPGARRSPTNHRQRQGSARRTRADRAASSKKNSGTRSGPHRGQAKRRNKR